MHRPTRRPGPRIVALAGNRRCSENAAIMEGGDPSGIGQVAGWIFGNRTAASFRREPGGADTVEEVGGATILAQDRGSRTVEECRKAAPETFLYDLVNSMIANTK